jgi:hypothetical protein
MAVHRIMSAPPAARAPAASCRATPASGDADSFGRQLEQRRLREQAGKVVDQVVSAFMATAFFYPLLEQANDGGSASTRFDAGFAEQSFHSRLNLMLADQIAASPRLPVGAVLERKLDTWLDRQPAGRLRELVASSGVDRLG